MWNNPEIKPEDRSISWPHCVYGDTLEMGEFQSKITVQDFTISKKHDTERRQPRK